VAKILIAGAGRLGLPLALALSGAGHEVAAIRRGEPRDAPGDIRWHRLDLRDPATVQVLDRDFDLVIVILTPAARSPEGYRQIYQEALDNLLGRLESSRVRPACLFVSATSVYAQNGGEWVDEDSPASPGTYNGRSLLSAEEAVLGWSPNPLVVRFAGIYGPDRMRLVRQLEKPLTIQRTPPAHTNRVHQEDCVGILRFLAELQLGGRNSHRIYLGADHCPAPKFEMMSWLARTAGLPEPLPLDVAEDAPRNKRCSNRRLVEAGYRFSYPDYKSGYRAMLQGGRPDPDGGPG